MDKIRVLRILEFIGDRKWVENTVSRSIHGTKRYPNGEVRAVTIGEFPEILEEDKPDKEEPSEASSSTRTMRVLEDVTDRACRKEQMPLGMSLSDFVDWLRGLYPELYQEKGAKENERLSNT